MSGDKRVGIRIEAEAGSFVAGANEAANAARRLNEETARQAAAQTEASAVINRAALSAKQYQQAMRQLPAQITDVTTSLASGMPVWMVAIQQGGQIKDSFGGIVPAGRALLSLVSPLTLGFAAIGAAAAAAAVAVSHGVDEERAFQAALRDTNNAAGTTVGQLNEIAKAAAAVSGTRSQAAAAVAALAGTGRVDGSDLERFTTVAVQAQRLLGQEVAATAKAFAELARDPVTASLKLNEATNYLTGSVLAQIRALQGQGRQAEAAALAQNAYADSLNRRAGEAELSLGALERGWLAVKGAAAKAWDAMLDIGRNKSPEEEIARIEKWLAAAPRIGVDAKTQAAYRQKVEELRAGLLAEREAAAAQGAAVDREQKAIEDQSEKHQSALTSLAKAQSALRLAETQAALAQQESATKIAYERFEADARTTGDKLVAIERARIDAQLQEVARLKAIESRNPDELARAAALAQLEAKRLGIVEQRSRLEAEIASGRFEPKPHADPLGDFIDSKLEAQAKRDEDRVLKARGFARDLADENARTNADLIRDDEARGRALIEIDRAVMERRLDDLQVFGQERVDIERQIQERSALAARKLTESLKPEWQRMLEDWEDPVRQMNNAFDAGITQALKSGEDAWRQFATTGKLSISDLGRSIEAEVASYAFRRLTSMLLGLIGGGSGSSWFEAMVPGGRGFVFHGGGVVGADSPAGMRALPAWMWAGAPRLHGGMLAPDEKPAILQDGESVLTREQMRMLAPKGSQPVQVTLINQSGTPMQAEARQNGSGGVEVVLRAVQDAIAGDIAAGAGPVSRALQGRYGLRPGFTSA